MSAGQALPEKLFLFALSAVLVVAGNEDNHQEEEEDTELVAAAMAAQVQTLRMDTTVVVAYDGALRNVLVCTHSGGLVAL